MPKLGMTVQRTGVPAWIALAMLMVLAEWLSAAAPVHACSCLDRFGAMLWPLRDAVGVPIDTPIVIQRRSFDGDPSVLPIRLLDERGSEVALSETRVHEHPALGSCWAHETLFLRPAEPLAPNATYEMLIGEDEEGRAFTTGTAAFEPSEYPTPSIRYMHVALENCTDTGEACELGELSVSFSAPIPDGLWLRLRSAAESDNENRWLFSPEWSSSPQESRSQLSVVLPPGDTCVELGLYGVDGSVVLERELCEPDVCVLYSSRGFSTCGEPPTSALDMRRVPSLGCDEPVVIEDGNDGPIYPEPEPDLPDAGPIEPIDSGVPSGGAGGGDSGSSGSAGTSADEEPEDPEMERKTVTACSCEIVGGGRGAAPEAAWLLVVLGLARLGRRIPRIRNQ